MIQATSNTLNSNNLNNSQPQKKEKQEKKDIHFHENLARQFVFETLVFSLFVPMKVGATVAGAYALAALVDRHGCSMAQTMSDFASSAKSTGLWIGERIDEVLLGKSQEEAAVKVEDVKSQIFNK